VLETLRVEVVVAGGIVAVAVDIAVALAMLVACFVTGALPTVAGAAMHDGNGHAWCKNAF